METKLTNNPKSEIRNPKSACDPSGYGEGRIYLGSTTVKTNSLGTVGFTFAVRFGTPICESSITATATDPDGNTSEFSRCKPITGQLFCPKMDLFPIPFDLGIIPKDTFVNKVLTVRNIGNAPLMVTPRQPSAPEFQLVSPKEAFTLQRGQRRNLTLRFRPRMLGQFRTMMLIESNDPAQPMVNVEMMGASCSPPLLAPLPDTIQMKLGEMKTIPLAVMDGQTYCQYKFSISPALSFATLEDKKDGTAVLRLTPTVQPTGGPAVGTYKLTVMVSDGSAPPQSHSRAITIIVSR